MKHQREIRHFLLWLDKPEITKREVRAYLKTIEGVKYEHAINALRRFFRDFLEQEDLIKGFKLPYRAFRPNRIPTKNELIRLYEILPDIKVRAFFLLIASSGLRTSEALSLQHTDIDLDKRMIIPKTRSSTKHTWITFYTIEAEEALMEYNKTQKGGRLFKWGTTQYRSMWQTLRKDADNWITPKILRMWFCSEMANQSVPDRYVDAFCGRVPKSVLARHYTDFSPSRLKQIYDQAGITILH